MMVMKTAKQPWFWVSETQSFTGDEGCSRLEHTVCLRAPIRYIGAKRGLQEPARVYGSSDEGKSTRWKRDSGVISSAPKVRCAAFIAIDYA
jgi:hypothetical protein